MAYFSQEMKKELAPKVKVILNEYGLKGSLSIRHHSTVVLKITSGKLDILGNFAKIESEKYPNDDTELRQYVQINTYNYKNCFDGQVLECIDKLVKVMSEGNWDHSDYMSDYFDVGWYVDIAVGTWDNPFKLID